METGNIVFVTGQEAAAGVRYDVFLSAGDAKMYYRETDAQNAESTREIPATQIAEYLTTLNTK